MQGALQYWEGCRGWAPGGRHLPRGAGAEGRAGLPSISSSSGVEPGAPILRGRLLGGSGGRRELWVARSSGGACPGWGRKAEPRSVGARSRAERRGRSQVPSSLLPPRPFPPTPPAPPPSTAGPPASETLETIPAQPRPAPPPARPQATASPTLPSRPSTPSPGSGPVPSPAPTARIPDLGPQLCSALRADVSPRPYHVPVQGFVRTRVLNLDLSSALTPTLAPPTPVRLEAPPTAGVAPPLPAPRPPRPGSTPTPAGAAGDPSPAKPAHRAAEPWALLPRTCQPFPASWVQAPWGWWGDCGHALESARPRRKPAVVDMAGLGRSGSKGSGPKGPGDQFANPRVASEGGRLHCLVTLI